MAKLIDNALSDGKVLLKNIDENETELKKKAGFSLKRQELDSSYKTALDKNTDQNNAVKFVNEKTIEQNNAITALQNSIIQTQKAAKAAYGETDQGMKIRYRIGEVMPKSVKGLTNWGNYFNNVFSKDKALLLENGLEQTDIDVFNTSLAILESADTVQEDAKKKKNAATKARDIAIADLKDKIKRFRNFIAAGWPNDEAFLLKFKIVPKGRGKEKEKKVAST